LCTHRYTVMRDTRHISATSATVKNRGDVFSDNQVSFDAFAGSIG
jgi:hypothetical protein